MDATTIPLEPTTTHGQPSAPYRAARPVESLHVGDAVMVPWWVGGEVVGWTRATVYKIQLLDLRGAAAIGGTVSSDGINVMVRPEGLTSGLERGYSLYSLGKVEG